MDRTASRAPRTTSSRSSSGFTLIEILLVLGIISMVMAIGLPAISRVTLQRLNSTTRQFVGLVRTIRNDSILLNTVYRLAIDFDKRTYWVEEQKAFQLLTEDDAAPKQKQSKKKAGPKDDKPEGPSGNFTYAEKYNNKPHPMPGGTEFTGVLKEKEGLRNDGVVYVHFFPNGFNDQAILYLAKEGAPETAYSLVIRATSGRVDIFRETVKNFDAVK